MKDEALKQAREWIKAQPRGWMTDGFNEVIADINEALAQPAQEPMDDVREFLAARLTCWHRLTKKESDELVALFEVKPPQRFWVGLTEEETSGFTSHEMAVVKYVSKVLQEKNT